MENLNKLSDDKLLSLYVNGNNDAFDVIIRRYESKVFSYIAYSVKNQELAEDIFQDTFVKAIYAIQQGKYAENGKFSSWIMRIAHNALLDYYRIFSCGNSVAAPYLFASQKLTCSTTPLLQPRRMWSMR